MKKLILFLVTAALTVGCTNDDQYSWEGDFADLTATDTINIGIAFNGVAVTVTGDSYGYVTAEGADVTVKSSTNKFLLLTLSGSTDNGSLTIYSWKKAGVLLNGVSITNDDGPAINCQHHDTFMVKVLKGTTNTLADGAVYADAPVTVAGDTLDQKGTLFSEGDLVLCGAGTLQVTGNNKNAIASDDQVFVTDSVDVVIPSAANNGLRGKDGVVIDGGTLTISVTADGARGIKSDGDVIVAGGNTTITTDGDCKIETIDGVADTTSCAGIKCDSLFSMSAGRLTITSNGDGGKGINSGKNVEFSGGILDVTTTGSNEVGKPKGVKSDTGILVSGGTFMVSVDKSWACDNGYDDESLSDNQLALKRLTVVGTPKTSSIKKKTVTIKF